jgi:hypothetical protein
MFVRIIAYAALVYQSLDARSALAAGTATATTIVGLTLSQWQSVLTIIATVVGIVATVLTLWMQVRWHRRRMSQSTR